MAFMNGRYGQPSIESFTFVSGSVFDTPRIIVLLPLPRKFQSMLLVSKILMMFKIDYWQCYDTVQSRGTEYVFISGSISLLVIILGGFAWSLSWKGNSWVVY